MELIRADFVATIASVVLFVDVERDQNLFRGTPLGCMHLHGIYGFPRVYHYNASKVVYIVAIAYILKEKNLSVKKIDLSAVGKIGPTKRTKEKR